MGSRRVLAGKPPPFSPLLLGTISAAMVVLAACGGGEKLPPPGAQAYSFATEDGVILQGHLVGRGDTAVVLSHMRPADESSWYEFAGELADRGFLALTFNFRGYSPSGGSKDFSRIDADVEAAVKSLRQTSGVKQVVLVGASMGGTASLKVAARQEVAGVITLSAPVEVGGLSAERDIAVVSAPKLFLAGAADLPARDSTRLLYDRAPEPKQTLLRTGSAHGTDLLKGAQGSPVRLAIVQFLEGLREK